MVHSEKVSSTVRSPRLAPNKHSSMERMRSIALLLRRTHFFITFIRDDEHALLAIEFRRLNYIFEVLNRRFQNQIYLWSEPYRTEFDVAGFGIDVELLIEPLIQCLRLLWQFLSLRDEGFNVQLRVLWLVRTEYLLDDILVDIRIGAAKEKADVVSEDVIIYF